MVVDTSTLERLRTLEQLYAGGYRDTVVDQTVRKLIEHQVQKDEAQLAELRDDLLRYEAARGMSSEEFYARYQRGEMGDGADAFEWNTLYEMHWRLQEAVELLRAQLD